MTKTATALMEPIDLQVAYEDGTTHDYQTCPLDAWRAEKQTGTSIAQAVDTYTGLAALAYSCALRANHAYKQRSTKTKGDDLFEQWLQTVTSVAVLVDEDDDPAEETPARPLDGTPSDGGSPTE